MFTQADNDKYLNSLEIQKRLTSAKQYNNWLFAQVEKYIRNCVLEVGCALGNFTCRLVERCSVCAIDTEGEYIKKVGSDFRGYRNFKAIQCDISSAEVLKLKQGRFNTIICFNVLEHVENDVLALKNMHYLLEKDGFLCLIVPAFQGIFGEMDRTDNHYRRYNKNLLLKKVKMSGFHIVKTRYMNMPGFFGWWFNGIVLKRRFIPFRQMLTYEKIIPLVSIIEKIFEPPFGQSLVLVAKK